MPSSDSTLRAGAIIVAKTLQDAGFQAVFAGGCVRDLVLGHPPADYDIATDAPPEAVIALFDRSIPVGIQFGVVRVLLAEHEYEVATFRAEAAYVDGRRPTDVRWANAREDVLRRDFTVNGLLQDPISNEIIDFVDGQADLAARLIRAIGDPHARFSEDYLRLLRAVRFASRLAFTIDPATWAALEALAPAITKISAERIGDELDKMLAHPHAARALTLLRTSGLLTVLLPELTPGDLALAQRTLARLPPTTALTGWGSALLQRPELVAPLTPRLRWSRAFSRDLTEALVGARALGRWTGLTLADQKRTLRRPTFPTSLAIAEAADLRDAARAARELGASLLPEALRPAPLLTGHDLEAAGHRPGPAFREALIALETAQLEGTVRTRDEAWALLRPLLAGGHAAS